MSRILKASWLLLGVVILVVITALFAFENRRLSLSEIPYSVTLFVSDAEGHPIKGASLEVVASRLEKAEWNLLGVTVSRSYDTLERVMEGRGTLFDLRTSAFETDSCGRAFLKWASNSVWAEVKGLSWILSVRTHEEYERHITIREVGYLPFMGNLECLYRTKGDNEFASLRKNNFDLGVYHICLTQKK